MNAEKLITEYKEGGYRNEYVFMLEKIAELQNELASLKVDAQIKAATVASKRPKKK